MGERQSEKNERENPANGNEDITREIILKEYTERRMREREKNRVKERKEKRSLQVFPIDILKTTLCSLPTLLKKSQPTRDFTLVLC